MQVEENLSVEKYLKAIATMTNTIGKLDVLKLHLKGMYDDKMSVAIIESIIKDLWDRSYGIGSLSWNWLHKVSICNKLRSIFLVLLLSAKERWRSNLENTNQSKEVLRPFSL